MAETTRTLISDEDLDCLDTLDADGGMNVSDLYVLAPRLRGRWVAEALESAADGGSPMDDLAGDLTVSAVTSTRLRHLAAEYRAGTR